MRSHLLLLHSSVLVRNVSGRLCPFHSRIGVRPFDVRVSIDVSSTAFSSGRFGHDRTVPISSHLIVRWLSRNSARAQNKFFNSSSSPNTLRIAQGHIFGATGKLCYNAYVHFFNSHWQNILKYYYIFFVVIFKNLFIMYFNYYLFYINTLRTVCSDRHVACIFSYFSNYLIYDRKNVQHLTSVSFY